MPIPLSLAPPTEPKFCQARFLTRPMLMSGGPRVERAG
jgi:hypothetical protein